MEKQTEMKKHHWEEKFDSYTQSQYYECRICRIRKRFLPNGEFICVSDCGIRFGYAEPECDPILKTDWEQVHRMLLGTTKYYKKEDYE
jgi:hypothetical protein